MDEGHEAPPLKPLEWIASAKQDLVAFPAPVRKALGWRYFSLKALFLAQAGETAPKAKPLKGFGGAGVLEVADDHDGSAFRAVYTVKFAEVVFVLHVLAKEIQNGNRHTQIRTRVNPPAA